MQGEEMKRQVLLDRDLKPLLALQSTYNIPQCDNYQSQLLNIQLDKYRCLPSTILQNRHTNWFQFVWNRVLPKNLNLTDNEYHITSHNSVDMGRAVCLEPRR